MDDFWVYSAVGTGILFVIVLFGDKQRFVLRMLASLIIGLGFGLAFYPVRREYESVNGFGFLTVGVALVLWAVLEYHYKKPSTMPADDKHLETEAS